MKTWLTWLALVALLWTVPPVLRAQGPATTQGMETPPPPAANPPAQPQPEVAAAQPAQPNAAAQPAQPNAAQPAQPNAAAQPAQPGSAAAMPAPAPTPAEAEKVEATVEQLEQLINAPESARLGREVDEPGQTFALFGDKKRVDELLGENPRYVYMPSGTDPMIVPWIRNRVMAAELIAEASELMSSGKCPEALAKVDLVLERFGDTDSVDKARKLKIDIERCMQNLPADDRRPRITPGPTPPTLPIWIPQNTRGVVYDVNDPKNSIVLIGEYVLHAGETIPSFPGIKVVAIERSMVTLDYQGEVFRLQVEGN